jgi:hypothetical protein
MGTLRQGGGYVTQPDKHAGNEASVACQLLTRDGARRCRQEGIGEAFARRLGVRVHSAWLVRARRRLGSSAPSFGSEGSCTSSRRRMVHLRP